MKGPIYEPSGRAHEYSHLALNLYKGCTHGCTYCYVPMIPPRRTREEFHKDVHPRENILDKLETQCKKMKGDPRDILLCFTSDPYQPFPPNDDITRAALILLEKYEMKAQILTKGGLRAVRDFDILARNEWRFGTSLSFLNNVGLTKKYEPNAAPVASRRLAIYKANDMGIKTWVSVEPVINPTQALHVILELRDIIDYFKVGKINYNKELSDRVDWKRFLSDTVNLLLGKEYYIKEDLTKAARME